MGDAVGLVVARLRREGMPYMWRHGRFTRVIHAGVNCDERTAEHVKVFPSDNDRLYPADT
jgi:hypothetical protein